MAMYPYKKLWGQKPIRLLRLEPGHSLDPIRCGLEQSSLLKHPKYCALSYTWGPKDNPVSLYCDNIEINVTRSLHAALVRFRLSCGVRILWVDAICINQNDNDEKTEQIRLMRDIYSKAQQGLIWLGCHQEEDKKAFAVLQKLGEFVCWYHKYKTIAPPQLQGRSLPMEIPAVATKLQELQISAMDWSYLNSFFQRSWFSRAWVIQEAVLVANNPLPTILTCGELEISWNMLADVANGILSLGLFFLYGSGSGSLQGLGHTSVCLIDRLRRSRTGPSPPILLSMLDSTRETCATDPRDKVFALYGLISPDEASETRLLPNYNKSCVQVYTDVAIYYLTKYKMLAFLQRVPWTLPQNGGYGGITGLPSWVPDWSKRHVVPFLGSSIYSAGGNLSPMFRFCGRS